MKSKLYALLGLGCLCLNAPVSAEPVKANNRLSDAASHILPAEVLTDALQQERYLVRQINAEFAHLADRVLSADERSSQAVSANRAVSEFDIENVTLMHLTRVKALLDQLAQLRPDMDVKTYQESVQKISDVVRNTPLNAPTVSRLQSLKPLLQAYLNPQERLMQPLTDQAFTLSPGRSTKQREQDRARIQLDRVSDSTKLPAYVLSPLSEEE